MRRLLTLGLVVLATCAVSSTLRAGDATYPAWPLSTDAAKDAQTAAAKHLNLPVEKRITLASDVALQLVLIPAGRFVMGRHIGQGRLRDGIDNELPLHEVTLPTSFYLGKFEVTQAQWKALVGSNPSKTRDEPNSAQLPVEQILPSEIERDFLPALAKKLPSGWSCRLPTEAEWEYACRAGVNTPFSFGNELLPTQANWAKQLKPVGSFSANAWGLHDMHGNVWEYCQDLYDPEFYSKSPATSPLCTARAASHANVEGQILRGGSIDYTPHYCRAFHRGWAGEPLGSNNRYAHRGLRVVVEPTSP